MTFLVVIARSDSFSSLWPELAPAGAEVRVVAGAHEAGALADALAVVLAVAGVEEEAEAELRALAAAGAPAPLVVGARADHRLAATLVRGEPVVGACPHHQRRGRASRGQRAQFGLGFLFHPR
ncbi:MAG TPA: hypothetical protein VE913_19745, partial [Longimicrobium sp.]|nr:hypothetical protein [Longimicrobium sp.]